MTNPKQLRTRIGEKAADIRFIAPVVGAAAVLLWAGAKGEGPTIDKGLSLHDHDKKPGMVVPNRSGDPAGAGVAERLAAAKFEMEQAAQPVNPDTLPAREPLPMVNQDAQLHPAGD